MPAARPLPADPPDERLLATWRAGDPRAFEVLFDRYNDRLVAYAFRLLGRREEAEEVCVEAFVRLLEGRSPQGPLGAWLFTVAHRRALDRLRKRTRRDRILRWFGATEPAAEPCDPLVLGERTARLERALQGLGEEHRAVVWLTYVEGLSAAEVAPIVGRTEQQVRSRLTYARRLLRETLEVDDG